MEQINHSLDGIDHINIYSKGKTTLGRDLSNFAHTPFTHPEYGSFESIEGFWFWLKCFLFNGVDHEELRSLYGYNAKAKGSELFVKIEKINHEEYEEFKEKIIGALKIKLRTHRNILNSLVGTTLPLKHYYVFNDGKPNAFVKDLPEYKWIVDTFEDIRAESQKFLASKGKTFFSL